MSAASESPRLDGPRFKDDLAAAVGAALTFASDFRAPYGLLEPLGAAAGYLLLDDPNLGRIGRTAGLNALASFSRAVSPQHPDWRRVVDQHFEPFAARLLSAARPCFADHPDLDAAASGRFPQIAIQSYAGGLAFDPWEPVEVAGRLRQAQADLLALAPGDDPAGIRPAVDSQLERTIGELAKTIAAAWPEPKRDAAPPPGSFRRVATEREALVDALVNPASLGLTQSIHSDGFLAQHEAAIRDAVGDPVPVPVAVLSNDRWFKVMHPDLSGASAVHVRGSAILLTRTVGEQALIEKEAGRLSYVLVHELVHATQRNRRGPLVHPPYEPQTTVTETKVLEGLTEYFTHRVMRRARTEWRGEGTNPYTQREFRQSAYYGYRFVCLAAIRVAGGIPEAFMRELSHNPHKLTILTELLTGEYTEERKRALADVLESLFSLAEAWLGEPRRIESELGDAATKEFERYVKRFASAKQTPQRTG